MKGDAKKASEKLREAKAVTGMNIESFLKSQPYESEENTLTMSGIFDAII